MGREPQLCLYPVSCKGTPCRMHCLLSTVSTAASKACASHFWVIRLLTSQLGRLLKLRAVLEALLDMCLLCVHVWQDKHEAVYTGVCQ